MVRTLRKIRGLPLDVARERSAVIHPSVQQMLGSLWSVHETAIPNGAPVFCPLPTGAAHEDASTFFPSIPPFSHGPSRCGNSIALHSNRRRTIDTKDSGDASLVALRRSYRGAWIDSTGELAYGERGG